MESSNPKGKHERFFSRFAYVELLIVTASALIRCRHWLPWHSYSFTHESPRRHPSRSEVSLSYRLPPLPRSVSQAELGGKNTGFPYC